MKSKYSHYEDNNLEEDNDYKNEINQLRLLRDEMKQVNHNYYVLLIMLQLKNSKTNLKQQKS